MSASWVKKFSEKQFSFLFTSNYAVIFIQEPWIKHSQLPLVQHRNYKTIPCLHPDKAGPAHGGILCYIRLDLFAHATIHQQNNNSYIDFIHISIANWDIVSAYLPHANSNYRHHWDTNPLSHLLAQMAVVLNSSTRPFILMGDLNAHTGTAPNTQTDERGVGLLGFTALECLDMGRRYTYLGTDGSNSVIDYVLTRAGDNRLVKARVLSMRTRSAHAPISARLTLSSPITPTPLDQLPHNHPPLARRTLRHIDGLERAIRLKAKTTKKQHKTKNHTKQKNMQLKGGKQVGPRDGGTAPTQEEEAVGTETRDQGWKGAAADGGPVEAGSEKQAIDNNKGGKQAQKGLEERRMGTTTMRDKGGKEETAEGKTPNVTGTTAEEEVRDRTGANKVRNRTVAGRTMRDKGGKEETAEGKTSNETGTTAETLDRQGGNKVRNRTVAGGIVGHTDIGGGDDWEDLEGEAGDLDEAVLSDSSRSVVEETLVEDGQVVGGASAVETPVNVAAAEIARQAAFAAELAKPRIAKRQKQKVKTSVKRKRSQSTASTEAIHPDTLSSLRKRTKLLLARRQSGVALQDELLELITARKHLRRLERARQTQSYMRKLRRLQRIPAGRGFWTYVNRVFKQGGTITASAKEVASHMKSTMTAPETEELDPLTAPAHPLADVPFDEAEIQDAIDKMGHASPGLDKIAYDDLRQIPLSDLVHLFAEIARTGQVPQSWKHAIVVAVPKPGRETHIPTNLRPISLQPTLRKVYNSCLVNRFHAWLEQRPILPEGQIGFRPGRRTGDNLFVVRCLHERYVAKEQPLHLVSLDIKKAFDYVNVKKLFKTLNDIGFVGSHIRALLDMYSNREASVRVEGRYSDAFPVSRGVGQGDPPSPILFITYLAQTSAPHPDDPTLMCPPDLPGAIVTNGRALLVIPELLIADDITHPSTSMEGCVEKADRRSRECAALNLHMARDKGAHLILADSSSMRDVAGFVTEKDGNIERRETLKLNGFILQGKKQWRASSDATMQHNFTLARGAFAKVMELHKLAGLSSIRQLWTLYQLKVLSQFNYAIEVCVGYDLAIAHQLDQFHKDCVRLIFGVHIRTIFLPLFNDLDTVHLTARLLYLQTKFLRHLFTTRSPNLTTALYTSVYLCNAYGYGWLWDLRKDLLHRLKINSLDVTSMETLETSLEPTLILIEKASIATINKAYVTQLQTASRLSVLRNHSQPKSSLAYLDALLPYGRAIAKMRVSSHPFHIETGRGKLDAHQRFCPSCQTRGIRLIENEMHVAFTCADHAMDRGTVWRRLDLYLGAESLTNETSDVALTLSQWQSDDAGNEDDGTLHTVSLDLTQRWLPAEWASSIMSVFIDPQTTHEANVVGKFWHRAIARAGLRK